ncbi:hypothetical protein ThvES_00015690 [Thiovulum sp. ES]|nr:hypothetical protein ThvES_00015690 [Thiovulum sp. ES]
MTLDLSNEGILHQLGMGNVNDALLNQVSAVRENTNQFEAIEKHIFDLHRKLEKIDAYVALSNSENYLKIKHHQSANRTQNAEFHEMVKEWASKYKVKLQTVNDNAYYILGLDK